SSSSQEIYGMAASSMLACGHPRWVSKKILRQAALVPRSSGQWHRSPILGGMAYRLSIQQGVSMGRRSEIEAEARKSGSVVTSVSVGGATTYIASGEIDVPPSALVS